MGGEREREREREKQSSQDRRGIEDSMEGLERSCNLVCLPSFFS